MNDGENDRGDEREHAQPEQSVAPTQDEATVPEPSLAQSFASSDEAIAHVHVPEEPAATVRQDAVASAADDDVASTTDITAASEADEVPPQAASPDIFVGTPASAIDTGSPAPTPEPTAPDTPAPTPPAEPEAAPSDGTPVVAPSAQQSASNEERRRRAQEAWEAVVAARESGSVLEGTVTASVKGGLLVDVGGIRGFLPASQTRVAPGSALDGLVRTKVPLKVIDVDPARRRIVVSHRRAVEAERRSRRAEVLAALAPGQTREGTVVRLTDFGAFVDLGGIDGLIPMRELAFERVEKASDVVAVGERLAVQVLRIEENGKKISLSRKNALPDPWRDHGDVLRQGRTMQGKVVAKEPRLHVEIAPGIVGSLRDSDANPSDYELGESIEVAIRSIDRRTRRIVLAPVHAESEARPTSTGFAPLGVELGRRP
ncbi:MAG: S1 RNA-binding domain-containing protein [Candidatus Eremiobacteraeota bacterium]|nr:S1 RNA-binding domain-containing protein [Candidatus Eremiobacteraeota bacterium]